MTLAALGLFGAALFFGESMITPAAISPGSERNSLNRAVRAVLADGGSVLIIDERVADAFAAPADDLERSHYAWAGGRDVVGPGTTIQRDPRDGEPWVRAATLQEALATCGIELSVWRIHRRIGMSGGLFIDALSRETGVRLDEELSQRLRELHAQAYLRRHETVVPLPGARELLAHLHERQVPFAVATSGARHTAGSALALLGLPDDVPVVTRDLVERAKPDPHLFLAAARRLGVDPAHCFVVGDSVWDLLAAQRAGALGIGLLSGGYGREELERSGAYRVYADPAEMLTRLEEVGVRPIR